MKYTISLVCISLSLAIFLATVNASEALMRFILVGEVPGTTVMISPAGMLALWGSIVIFSLVKLFAPLLNARRLVKR